MTRVAFLCCHLTGTGHLVRTLALARATQAAGADVRVISGGRPLTHVDAGDLPVVQLPPVEVADFDYSTLRLADGTPADQAYLDRRIADLRADLAGFRPSALVTELYPLGRRVLTAEFETAIATARDANPHVAIIASVRDIPEPPKKPGRLEQAAERLRRDYAALLVHGDAGFLPLFAAWPLPCDLAPIIHHTGYVAEPMPKDPGPPGETVLVAVGGGILGRRLLELAARAAAHSTRPWHLLVGGPDAASAARALTTDALANLTAEPPRRDFRQLLGQAACSVTLAGYNTTLDLLGCTTPAIVVPFDEMGEREHEIRAARLAGLPGFTVLKADALTPEALAKLVEAAATGPRRRPHPVDRNGAARAAAKILKLAR